MMVEGVRDWWRGPYIILVIVVFFVDGVMCSNSLMHSWCAMAMFGRSKTILLGTLEGGSHACATMEVSNGEFTEESWLNGEFTGELAGSFFFFLLQIISVEA